MSIKREGSLTALPHCMKNEIPTVVSCLALMEKYEMLENIKAHSFVVASVAQALLDGFTLPAETLPSVDVLVAGALLHDIAKTKCLAEHCNHAEVGQKLCLEHGYKEVGEIVNEHVVLHSFSPERYSQGIFSAKDIIYYADKRVNHDSIVTLDQRLDYILERYGGGDEKRHALIYKNFQKCLDLESFIFFHMSFLPEDLPNHVVPFSHSR